MLDAYSDCNSESKSERNLMFRASHAVMPVVAAYIMKRALGKSKSYNGFYPVLLEQIDFPIVLAREYSVAVYVPLKSVPEGGVLPSKKKMMADEFDSDDNGFARYWWD